jgi:hypothetical protein
MNVTTELNDAVATLSVGPGAVTLSEGYREGLGVGFVETQLSPVLIKKKPD